MSNPQIHPSAATPPPSSAAPPPEPKTAKPPNPQPSRPVPPPAAYVVQLPRDQILRYPPPENATKFQELNRRKNRRRRCCCCCLALSLLLLIAAAAVSVAVIFLVYDFKSPRYEVTKVSIKKMNLTSSAPISPEFDVSVRAANRNGKVGVYYKDSIVNIVYRGTELGAGAWPAFYQPKKNVTVLRVALITGLGNNVGKVKTELRKDLGRRRVTFVVNVDAPVKFKVGSVKTWEFTVKVSCKLVVDTLNEKAKIVSKEGCRHSMRFW